MGLLFLFAGAVAKRSPGVLGSQRSQDTQSTRAETEGELGHSQDLEEEEEHEEEQLTEEQLPGRHHRAPARWACYNTDVWYCLGLEAVLPQCKVWS